MELDFHLICQLSSHQGPHGVMLLSLSVLRRADMREHTDVKWPIFCVCVWCNCTSIIWREEKVRAEVGGEGSTLEDHEQD